MADWPASLPAPSFGRQHITYKPQVRTPYDGNYVQTRPKVTRKRKQWPDYGWDALTAVHLATLQTFFDTYQGSSFSFPDPLTAVPSSCIFSADQIEAVPIDRDSDGLVFRVVCPVEEL